MFLFWHNRKTKGYPHWSVHIPREVVPIRRWHLWIQAWPEMKVQFAQIFQTKTRNEWVMTSAMLAPKAPRGSLVDTLQFQNDTTKIYKETCSKQSMAGCSWFQTVSSILVAPFSQKICLVYFSGVFSLPQAEVFKGTDACCVPVLNPSEAVGVLSCWVVEYATNFHGWISWILFCKAVHEHNRLRRSFLAQVFKAKMLRFLIPMYPNFLTSP